MKNYLVKLYQVVQKGRELMAVKQVCSFWLIEMANSSQSGNPWRSHSATQGKQEGSVFGSDWAASCPFVEAWRTALGSWEWEWKSATLELWRETSCQSYCTLILVQAINIVQIRIFLRFEGDVFNVCCECHSTHSTLNLFDSVRCSFLS